MQPVQIIAELQLLLLLLILSGEEQSDTSSSLYGSQCIVIINIFEIL